MQMSTFDTLSAFETLIATGLSHEQAKAQTMLLAKASEPDIDLKARFDSIDKKFELMDKDFMYIRLLCIGIIVAIVGSFIKGSL